jgi:predicted membrane-bound spermidine synthase
MTTISLLPGLDGIVTIEPLSMIFLILVQIGGRFLKIELTPAQQKIINNVIIQSIILFAIILMATKNIVNSFIIVSFIYLCVNILFNENHKYNILSKKWLYDEKIIETEYNNIKDIYIKNIKNI